MHEVLDLMMNNNVYILVITEIHLDDMINDGQIHLDGFNVMRKDRSRYGGGFIYSNHICL